jgi:hypothetical protein
VTITPSTAGQHGEDVEAAVAEVVVVTGMAAGESLQARFEQDRQRGEDQHHRQALLDDGVERRGVGVQGAEEPQGQRCGGHAAQAEQPVIFQSMFLLRACPDATGLGDGRIQQVGADGSPG